MKEIIIGILGGGAAVQLLNLLAMLGPTRRQGSANALSTEVGAMQQAIETLTKRVADQEEFHRREVETLRAEISVLRRGRERLESEVRRLREEVLRLGGSSEFVYTFNLAECCEGA